MIFFHIPLAEATQRHFGVLYDNVQYGFTRLPMGLKLAPSEMQLFRVRLLKLLRTVSLT